MVPSDCTASLVAVLLIMRQRKRLLHRSCPLTLWVETKVGIFILALNCCNITRSLIITSLSVLLVAFCVCPRQTLKVELRRGERRLLFQHQTARGHFFGLITSLWCEVWNLLVRSVVEQKPAALNVWKGRLFQSGEILWHLMKNGASLEFNSHVKKHG